MIKKSIILVIMISLVGAGAALALKAAVGVGSRDALAATVAGIVGIEVGTMGMGLNFVYIFIQIILLKKGFKKIQLLQFPFSILLGAIINVMLYDVFSMFTFNSYFIRIVALLLGNTICAFALAVLMVMNLITVPLEGACMAVSKKFNKKFHVIRQLFDVGAIVLIFILAFVFNQPLAAREGTIIGVLTFGPSMGIFMKLLTPIIKKHHLIY